MNSEDLKKQDCEAVEPLTPAELEARREWYRQYRRANPEKVKRWERNRWRRKAQQMQEGSGT